MASHRRIFTDSDADKVGLNQFGAVSQARDVSGVLLNRRDHGRTGDVDHIMPRDMGGSSSKLANLQVLNSRDNQEFKKDNYPTGRNQFGRLITQYGTK